MKYYYSVYISKMVFSIYSYIEFFESNVISLFFPEKKFLLYCI